MALAAILQRYTPVLCDKSVVSPVVMLGGGGGGGGTGGVNWVSWTPVWPSPLSFNTARTHAHTHARKNITSLFKSVHTGRRGEEGGFWGTG